MIKKGYVPSGWANDRDHLKDILNTNLFEYPIDLDYESILCFLQRRRTDVFGWG